MLDYPGTSLPQHAGLTATDVRNAEHDPEVLVEPLMEVSGDHDERWGVWDDERYDKQVEYMLRLISDGHGFSKSDWGGGEHWVGLCISLTEWSILVLDPNPRLNSIEEVSRLMKPLATMLPYIAQKVCPSVSAGDSQVETFLVDRLGGAYMNLRSGDCGPVAAKFMEMLATGNRNPTVAGLTDELVDIFRKQYAMDIYARLVVPLYLR
ncbi:hypothetical protein Rs2_31336 [Raphanus sativus]|nr:hypothetical protein Rs2_31336 [Raphanus sativus]